MSSTIFSPLSSATTAQADRLHILVSPRGEGSNRSSLLRVRLARPNTNRCMIPPARGRQMKTLAHPKKKCASLASIALAAALAFFVLMSSGANVVADLDGDGRLEFFRSCTSQEGVHFTIWADKPLQGKRRWHRYVYLGYDVEPTCTDPETEPDPI